MSRKNYPNTTPDWRAAVRRRTRFYIVVAVLMAILFGVLVFQFFARQQRIPPGELISVVIAAQDIKADTQITLDMIELRDVSIQSVPESHLNYLEQAVGELTLYPLVEGEVILEGKFVGGQGGTIAQRCSFGKWCVSIPLTWFIAPPPDLAVGDRVEIASVLPGRNLDEAGFIAAGVKVVELPGTGENPAYVFAVENGEALSLLYARANEFQLLVLLRPAGG